MRTMMKGSRALRALGAMAVGVLVLAGSASADINAVSTERSGSVLIYPKIVWDGERDTVIQIANTTNVLVQARCFYINAAPPNINLPPSVLNPPQCVETDFDIVLTKQQPLTWAASLGRTDLLTPGSPGLIPPVPFGFIGELKCIQVADDGNPTPGNALKGDAVLRRIDGDVAKYNAIALHGNPALMGSIDNDLLLNLTTANPNFPQFCSPDSSVNPGGGCDVDADCGTGICITTGSPGNPGGEFSACPDTLIVDFTAVGAQDLVLSGPNGIGDCDDAGGCPVTSDLTLVPCSENLENQIPASVTVGFNVFDEFEIKTSGSFTVTCFAEIPLATIPNFTLPFVQTLAGHARFTPVSGHGGLLGILEEVRHLDASSPPAGQAGATTAVNLHIEGNRFDAATGGVGNPAQGALDQIIIPAP